ncbi:glycosyltransferase [Chitinophaga pollutisoli]|uniref:Glycosyltransferase n=1 Tax=Chitinophaga pollutisoli TaxID=3133966 RepID=A0ABZ2YMR3_9BACT
MEKAPLISVILPVYNGGPFLRQTLEALLAQTLEDFELLVINDGSTDDSEATILSFTDPRIRYLPQSNQGFIASLNRGIAEARGKYIARIDADDVCLPLRFEQQAALLNDRPEVAVVGCFIIFIDENGKETGIWPEDRACVSNEQIRQALPHFNCIAHPGVMGRTEIFRQYPYRASQQHIEDYDLWLRLAGDDKVIVKLPQPLLLYRVHTGSVTVSVIKKNNIFLRHFHCKRRYLAGRIRERKWNGFDFRVLAGMCRDAMVAFGKSIKQRNAHV